MYFRLQPLRMRLVWGESAESQVRLAGRDASQHRFRRCGVGREKHIRPVNRQIRDDAKVTELRRKLDGNDYRFRLPGGHAHIGVDGDPLAAIVPGLEHRRCQAVRKFL